MKNAMMTALLASVLALGLGTHAQTAAASTVWEQLGGRDKVTAFTADAVERWRKNPVFADTFGKLDDARAQRLTILLVEQFCSLTGGGCTYGGLNMTDAHRGMNITTAQFNVLAEDLQRAMDAHRVPFFAQNRLLAELAPMIRDMRGK